MALSAEPALNHLIWLSLKVWFTGNSYVEPSGFLPTTVRALPGWKSVRPLMLILSKGPTCSRNPSCHPSAAPAATKGHDVKPKIPQASQSPAKPSVEPGS